jgi:hypothetical protein
VILELEPNTRRTPALALLISIQTQANLVPLNTWRPAQEIRPFDCKSPATPAVTISFNLKPGGVGYGVTVVEKVARAITLRQSAPVFRGLRRLFSRQ